MPSWVLNFHTPLQNLEWYVTLPSTLYIPLKIFGCVAFIHVLKHQRSKLDPCAICCVFLGYGSHTKGYQCYDPFSRKIYVTIDETFLETEYFFNEPSFSIIQGENRNEQQIWDWVHTEGHTKKELETTEQTNHTNLITQVTSNNPLSNIQHDQDQNREDIPDTTTEVRSPDSHTLPDFMIYNLPHRHNRGIPPNRYSSETEERKSRYSIANFILAHNMSDAIKVFIWKVSLEQVPRNIEEAMLDEHWKMVVYD